MASSTTMPRRPRPMNIHVARGSRSEHKYRALAGIPDLLPEALAPVQFQYSDFVHGPEGPVKTPDPPAKQKGHHRA